MPYLRDQPTDRLTLPSNPSYWVEMKQRASYGDVSAAQKATLEITTSDVRQLNGARRSRAIVQGAVAITPDFDGGAYLPALISRLVVRWNLDGPGGELLDITPENVKLLDGEDGEFLQQEAQRRAGGREPDQQDPSRKLSSEPSPQEPLESSPTTPTPLGN